MKTPTDWDTLNQARAQLEDDVRRDLANARQARDDAQAALEAAQYELEKLAVDSHRNNRLKSIEIEQLAGFKHSSWHKLLREWTDA
jgi:hypothetical protein